MFLGIPYVCEGTTHGVIHMANIEVCKADASELCIVSPVYTNNH